ncbi:hypothetical protein BXY58_2953 [Epilithonimonas arachidiradicis]|uniref:Uncharacterized protein n=1 Tax=Epilithonimonas arachidiradicis TaxID=1617282 RepID=A0A420CPX9_9FLAO|nr:hypothetical protein BXY58_2953 [Epilithonimonas arachidiradicis]
MYLAENEIIDEFYIYPDEQNNFINSLNLENHAKKS